MVPGCCRYNPVSTENYIYIIYGFRKYICGKGGLGGGGGERHLELSNKMELFPSYGSRIFCFTIFDDIIFLSTPLKSFYLFLAYQEPKYVFR